MNSKCFEIRHDVSVVIIILVKDILGLKNPTFSAHPTETPPL